MYIKPGIRSVRQTHFSALRMSLLVRHYFRLAELDRFFDHPFLHVEKLFRREIATAPAIPAIRNDLDNHSRNLDRFADHFVRHVRCYRSLD